MHDKPATADKLKAVIRAAHAFGRVQPELRLDIIPPAISPTRQVFKGNRVQMMRARSSALRK